MIANSWTPCGSLAYLHPNWLDWVQAFSVPRPPSTISLQLRATCPLLMELHHFPGRTDPKPHVYLGEYESKLDALLHLHRGLSFHMVPKLPAALDFATIDVTGPLPNNLGFQFLGALLWSHSPSLGPVPVHLPTNILPLTILLDASVQKLALVLQHEEPDLALVQPVVMAAAQAQLSSGRARPHGFPKELAISESDSKALGRTLHPL